MFCSVFLTKYGATARLFLKIKCYISHCTDTSNTPSFLISFVWICTAFTSNLGPQNIYSSPELFQPPVEGIALLLHHLLSHIQFFSMEKHWGKGKTWCVSLRSKPQVQVRLVYENIPCRSVIDNLCILLMLIAACEFQANLELCPCYIPWWQSNW